MMMMRRERERERVRIESIILQMCDSVDQNITSQLYKVGGANYTTISALAWRLVSTIAISA